MASDGLQRTALDHLWLHFTQMGGYADPEQLQVIVRGDGCYLEDSNGKRYLDALAGLFCVNIGYGYGAEMGEAAAAQMRELPFAINWTFAHPRVDRAGRGAGRARARGPQPRVLRVGRLGGRRGGVEARPRVPPRPRRAALEGHRPPGGLPRHHLGALSLTGCTELRTPFEPLVPDVLHVSNTNHYHRPPEETEAEFTSFLLDELEATIVQAGPDTVAMVIMEPVQNAGGSFTPPAGYFQGVRAICDEHGILLCADEVITRLRAHGHWFASERYDIRPDLITSAKGLSSAYAAIGAVIASERVMEPFAARGRDVHARHDLRRPSGAGRGGAEEHRDHAARAHRGARARPRGRLPRDPASSCWTCRSSATCAAAATSMRSSWSRTGRRARASRMRSARTCSAASCRPRCSSEGLICRPDDRGDPVIQISPPLVAGQAEFDEIAGTLGAVLEEAGQRMQVAA